MTLPVDSEPHCEHDNEPEITITLGMIEAGKAALAAYRPYFDLEEDAVISIYMAMVIAAHEDK
jgi:hypothetical protein